MLLFLRGIGIGSCFFRGLLEWDGAFSAGYWNGMLLFPRAIGMGCCFFRGYLAWVVVFPRVFGTGFCFVRVAFGLEGVSSSE